VKEKGKKKKKRAIAECTDSLMIYRNQVSISSMALRSTLFSEIKDVSGFLFNILESMLRTVGKEGESSRNPKSKNSKRLAWPRSPVADWDRSSCLIGPVLLEQPPSIPTNYVRFIAPNWDSTVQVLLLLRYSLG
jgi:hypothetical protein